MAAATETTHLQPTTTTTTANLKITTSTTTDTVNGVSTKTTNNNSKKTATINSSKRSPAVRYSTPTAPSSIVSPSTFGVDAKTTNRKIVIVDELIETNRLSSKIDAIAATRWRELTTTSTDNNSKRVIDSCKLNEKNEQEACKENGCQITAKENKHDLSITDLTVRTEDNSNKKCEKNVNETNPFKKIQDSYERVNKKLSITPYKQVKIDLRAENHNKSQTITNEGIVKNRNLNKNETISKVTKDSNENNKQKLSITSDKKTITVKSQLITENNHKTNYNEKLSIIEIHSDEKYREITQNNGENLQLSSIYKSKQNTTSDNKVIDLKHENLRKTPAITSDIEIKNEASAKYSPELTEELAINNKQETLTNVTFELTNKNSSITFDGHGENKHNGDTSQFYNKKLTITDDDHVGISNAKSKTNSQSCDKLSNQQNMKQLTEYKTTNISQNNPENLEKNKHLKSITLDNHITSDIQNDESKSVKKRKKSLNNLETMLLTQKQNDNLVDHTNLKPDNTNMENKQKQFKNSAKSNKITNANNESLDLKKLLIAKISKNNKLSQTSTSDSDDILAKEDDKNLQTSTDFDDQFWKCSENQNDNKVIKHKSDEPGIEGHEKEETFCEFCENENDDNLSITRNNYSKHSEKDLNDNKLQNPNETQNQITRDGINNELLSITPQMSTDNLETDNNIEESEQMKDLLNLASTNDSNTSNNLQLEMENSFDSREFLNNTTKADLSMNTVMVDANIVKAGILSSSENCVCICSEGAHNVLSIVKNGFVFNADNILYDVDDDDAADDIDDSDLPNYSHSCVYEERIIDFENFRIIEQVIDNNCEGKHTATNNIKCRNFQDNKITGGQEVREGNLTYNDNSNKVIDNCEEEIRQKYKEIEEATDKEHIIVQSLDHKNDYNKVIDLQNVECCELVDGENVGNKEISLIYENPSLNFSCSELVAFIGESYQVIDNAQALYETNNNVMQANIGKAMQKCPPQLKNAKESSSVGNSPLKRCKRAPTYASVKNVNTNRCVDDNNNTRRYAGISAADRLMQSLNCDVARREKRDVKPKAKALAPPKAVTPTKTLLKALKSKLTPLAPPFQPASIKAKLSSCSAANSDNSAAMVNYEQTTLYYHQQQQHQQQQQQQLMMANTSSLQQQVSGTQQQQQQLFISHHHVLQQQQQQQQQHQPHQHPLQLSHNHQHQQHCAQSILAMSAAASLGQAMPQIHLPAATTNNGNLSTATAVINVGGSTSPAATHHTLLPIHLISAVGGGLSWPLMEAATTTTHNPSTPSIYMDINGELRSICPAHGPPPTASAQPLTTPMAPQTNQTNPTQHSNAALGILQQNTICLNPSQYPLTLTAQYHPQQQQPHSHLHQQQHQHLQHHQHQHTHQQQPALANSQNSPLRIKSNSIVAAASTNNNNNNNAGPSTSLTATPSTSSSASTAPPRVVLQLDAGISLPLQIAGKRKLFRGFGNSDDGNTARRFFQNADASAQITKVDAELIEIMHVILIAVSCGHEIHVEKFRKYTQNTARHFVKLYPRYYMPPTLHKFLIHVPEIVRCALLPIGQLSEEAQEARNKDFKNYREHYSRKCSREKSNEDILYAKKTYNIPQMALDLLILPKISDEEEINEDIDDDNYEDADYIYEGDDNTEDP